MIWLWFLVSLSYGQCSASPVADMERSMATLWDAFLRVDEPTFDQAAKSLDTAVECLNAAPTREQVGRLHQAMALATFVNGQKVACRRSLRAARFVDPEWALTDSAMFPEGHMFRVYFAAAVPTNETTRLKPIFGKNRIWVVDGQPTDEVPTERAFLLQVQEGGETTWSAYLSLIHI